MMTIAAQSRPPSLPSSHTVRTASSHDAKGFETLLDNFQGDVVKDGDDDTAEMTAIAFSQTAEIFTQTVQSRAESTDDKTSFIQSLVSDLPSHHTATFPDQRIASLLPRHSGSTLAQLPPVSEAPATGVQNKTPVTGQPTHAEADLSPAPETLPRDAAADAEPLPTAPLHPPKVNRPLSGKGAAQIIPAHAEGRAAASTQKLDARTEAFINTMEDAIELVKRFEQTSTMQRPLAETTQTSVDTYPSASLTSLGHGSGVSPSSLGGVPTAAITLPQLTVATPVMHPGWAQAMSHQMMSFLRTHDRGAQVAEMRLDPPELGPLKISVSIKDGIARAQFVSANAAVRAAVEQALPQLAYQLSDAGVSLGQTSVEDRDAPFLAFSNDHERHREDNRTQQNVHTEAHRVDSSTETPSARSTHHLVHTYA